MSFAYSPINLTGSSSSAGGGNITVGASGATYTTVAEALAAGVNSFSIITDLTESSLITVPFEGLAITLENGTWNIGTGSINVGEYSLSLNGNGTLSYGNVQGTLLSGVAGAELHVEGITIENTSSLLTCLTNLDYARFANVVFEGNVRICGDSNIYDGCIYKSSTITVQDAITNTLIGSSIFESVVLSDSGVNTLISDAVVY